MVDQQYVDELLIGVFHFFPPNKRKWHYEKSRFHTFFYDRQAKYPELVGELDFSTAWGGLYKRCSQLDQTMDNLRMMGALGSWSHDYHVKEVHVSPHSSADIVEARFEELTDKLEALSNEFQEEFWSGLI